MKPTKTLIAVCAALALTATSAVAGTRNGPSTLAEDPSGDWRLDSQEPGTIGGAMAQDLVSASIDRVGPDLEFIIGVADVAVPDPMRRKTLYEWRFAVDGQQHRYVLYGPCTLDPLDLAFYGCAPQDAVATEPRMTLFSLAGGPAVVVSARIDEAADTFTVTVPMDAIGARTGSVITQDTSDAFEATIAATPDENGSLTGRGVSVGDDLTILKTYRVPRT